MDSAVEEKLYKFFSKFPLIEYKKSNILLRPEDTPQGVSYLLQGYVRRFFKANLKNGHVKIDFNITQKDIAQLAGITRETVCFEMKKLEANKSIKRANNSYIICNVKKLDTGTLISKSGVTPQTL